VKYEAAVERPTGASLPLTAGMLKARAPEALIESGSRVQRDNQGENGATIWMGMPLRGC